MLEIGTILDGKYKILNKIGQGGMSVVYLAMNERANKQWAVKEIRKDGVSNFEIVRQGLVAETDILKNLSHPSLPSIIDVIDGDGSFIIVMDYIEGRSLQDALKHYGAQREEDVIEWAKQLCDVLGYLHSRTPPIIYRDMKPANVMLKPNGNVTLIDFGTARLFKSSGVADTTCLGTQGYAAPEQFGGYGQTDARTDIYCLGATMYHLVTGHNPAEPPYEMYPIREWNSELSSGLEEIILKCTQRNPEDRYQSCAELMYALEHYHELDIEYRQRQKRRYSAFFAGLALTLVFSIGIGVFHSLQTGLLKSSYDSLIKNAETAGSFAEASEIIAEAIRLAPGDGRAYLTILNNAKDNADGVFSAEEKGEIRGLLYGNSSSATRNEELFKNGDPASYALFCYRYGLFVFFLSGDGGAPYSDARSWFQSALEYGDYLDENYAGIAELMYNISDFVANQNAGGKDAAWSESNYQFNDMWNDWIALLDNGQLKLYGGYVPEAACKLIVLQICEYADEFYGAGISGESMLAMLSRLKNETGGTAVSQAAYAAAHTAVEKATGVTAQ